MASQEFLASFAVDIDEAGVSCLQSVLEENRHAIGHGGCGQLFVFFLVFILFILVSFQS